MPDRLTGDGTQRFKGIFMSQVPTLAELLAAGLHFGHKTSKWNPKMKPYIYGNKQGLHIIDLTKTQEQMDKAWAFITKEVAAGKNILLVGTKDQVKKPLRQLAEKTGMPYITEHWLGGTLTNFFIIKNSIRKYKDILDKKKTGQLSKYTKKEQLEFDREAARLEIGVGGLVNLIKVPEIIFIWDIKKEKTALAESLKRRIPIVAICDSNTNPTGINYPIPANDDATKGIELVLASLEQAIMTGKQQREAAKESHQPVIKEQE